MNAQQLAQAVLDGEDPKKVLRQASAQRDREIPRGYTTYVCASCGQKRSCPTGSPPGDMRWSDGHVCRIWNKVDERD